MENCNLCGSPFKQVAAGVSKTPPHNPYQAFIACTKYGCKGKPTQGDLTPGATETPPTTYTNPGMQQGSNTAIKQPNTNDSIRENVALKMVSEIIAANKIAISDWEKYANEFYHFKPSEKPQENQPTKKVTTINDGELQVENIPF